MMEDSRMLSADILTFLSPSDIVDAPEMKVNIDSYLKINVLNKQWYPYVSVEDRNKILKQSFS